MKIKLNMIRIMNIILFKYGDCIDDEREMMVDGDVLWLIIFN